MAKRINVKISEKDNAWLDKKAEEMALSKSAVVNIAIQNYIKEIEVVQGMPKIIQTLEKHGITLD